MSILNPQQHQDPDLHIGQALQLLKDAQPTLGMEAMQQRLLTRLAARPAPKASRTFLPAWLTSSLAWPAAATLAAAATVVAVLSSHPHKRTASAYGAQISAIAHAPAGARFAPRGTSLSAPGLASATWGAQPRNPQIGKALSSPSRPAAGSDFQPASQPTPTPASFPAPPLPLTEQEQLMVHLAQGANPQQLTSLTAEQSIPANDLAGLNPSSVPPLPSTLAFAPTARLHPAPDRPVPPAAVSLLAAAFINFESPAAPPAAPDPDHEDTPAATSPSTLNPTPTGDTSWQPALK